MNKKTLVGVLLSSVMVMSLITGCGASKSEKYIIACDEKYAPFSFDENGKYKGIDVEILDAIAKEEKFEYELVPMEFAAIIPELAANQLDGAIAGISITEEREKTLDFSDGYFESGLSVVVNSDNTDIKGIEDLNGKNVSIKKRTTGSNYAEENGTKYGLKLNYFDDSQSMYQSVENKSCDFLLEDYPVIAYKIKADSGAKLKIAGPKLYSVNYGFAVKKGANQELLEKFNDGLKKLKENGKYDEIVGQYIAK